MTTENPFQIKNIPNDVLVMDNSFNVADCCRACLRIDCSLTPTSAQDPNDSIKFCDKLLACVSEIVSSHHKWAIPICFSIILYCSR